MPIALWHRSQSSQSEVPDFTSAGSASTTATTAAITGTSEDFLLLVLPPESGRPASAASRGRRFLPHVHTLHGEWGFFRPAEAAVREVGEPGHVFYAYGHHDLDVARTTAAVASPAATGAGGGGGDDDGAEACRLKDVPAGGAVYVCAAAIAPPKVEGADFDSAAAAPGPVPGSSSSGGPWEVGRHWLCRPAGPYERLEDAGLVEVSRWGQMGIGRPDPAAAPCRRRLFRVEAAGGGGGRPGPALPAAVGRLAVRLLAGSESSGRRRGRGAEAAVVPWGILFRVPTADVKEKRVEGVWKCAEEEGMLPACNSEVDRKGPAAAKGGEASVGAVRSRLGHRALAGQPARRPGGR